MTLYNYYNGAYHAVRPEACINVGIPKRNNSPFCPVCIWHNRRMRLEGKHYNCTECGRTFPIEDVKKEDIEKEDQELLKLMRSKIK
jgi:tRNA(Ile2) C34 agmatinyltransferase TiaS